MPKPFETRNMSLARLAPAMEIKLDPGSAGDGSVSGYASAFGGPPDSYGDIIAPGAFSRTIAEHKAEGTAPIMLWSHDQAEPIGRWVELREDDRGLFVRGKINLQTGRGRDAHAHLKAGDVNGLSVGIYVAENGRKAGDRGTNILTDVDLFEVSVVALPANRRARLNLESKGELEELLVKSGLAKKAAVRLAAGGWPALVGPDPEERARQVEAYAARIQKLTDSMRTK